MENKSVTGFSPSETAQLVPGVLSGKRLTLDNINERLLEVENALALLAADYYKPTESVNLFEVKGNEVIDSAEIFVTGGFISGPGLALEQANHSLRQEIEEKNAEIARLNDLVVHQDQIIDNLNDKLVAIREAMGNPEWID